MSPVAHASPSAPPLDPAPARWQDVYDFCPPRRLPSGTVLLRRGEAQDHAWVIERGEVEVRVGEGPDALVVGHLGEGDHVGGLGLLGLVPASPADVVCRGGCVVRRLEPATFQRLEATGSRAVARIEYDSVRALVAHRDAAMHALARHAADAGARPLDPPPAPALPHLLAWPLGLSLRALGGSAPRVVAPGQRLGALERGPGAGPGGWLVMEGALHLLRVARRGGLLGARPVGPGQVVGADHALNLASAPWGAVAAEGTVLLWLSFELLLRAMVAPSGGPRALRRAVLNSLALDLDDAQQRLLALSGAAGTAAVDLDQERMLRVAHRASAGAL
ncbi:cyclic nucleotide-binding domain-containing protein [Myxococcota bacterium]|nr:cyclic nucleotide-binding domain-containing protein [Myxococcota bacterium]